MLREVLGLLFVLLCVLGTQLPGFAQSAITAELIEERRGALEAFAAQITEAEEDELLILRENVRALRIEADSAAAPFRARLGELETDLEKIGAEAPEGVSELPSIVERRAALRAEFESISALVRQSDLNIVEANRLLTDIANRRRDAFYDRVLERDKPPFTFGAINAAIGFMKTDWATFAERYAAWKTEFETPGQFRAAWVSLLLSGFFAFILLWPLPHWMDRTLLTRFKTYEPTPSRRTSLAAWRVITRALPALLAATIIYQVAAANGVVTDMTSKLVGSVLLSLATIFVVDDVASAVFAPREPQWRLIPLESGRATLVRFLLVLTVIVFSANAVLNRLSDWLGSSRELVTLLSALIAVAGAVLFFLLARTRLWTLSKERQLDLTKESRNFWRWTRNLLGILSVLSIFAVMVGHVALGRYVLTRIYYLSFLIMAVWLVRGLLLELAEFASRQFARPLKGDELTAPAPQAEHQSLFLFWLRLLIDIIVIATVLPLAALVVGVEWTDLRNWVFDAIVGIEVGGFTISLVNILSAIVAVFAIMVVTRFIQRTMDDRVFEPARMESGLRNTFKTLIGYVGLVIGIMVGIGTLGFPLANLAIVAGALSVGIGFGLQSIVNNFVSGLILLFERPIKVGDWVVTSAGEGIVKRISVRSTEIETFDWASVIVPNSELVTSPVTNWTHKNRYTRLIIPVSVSYSADPEEVTALLLKEAKTNRRTLSYPTPVVFFSGFGDSALDFEVRVFINNVDDRIPVQNELRIAIFKTLDEAGIEIPFPQRDLHLKGLVPGTAMPDPAALMRADIVRDAEVEDTDSPSDKGGKGDADKR